MFAFIMQKVLKFKKKNCNEVATVMLKVYCILICITFLKVQVMIFKVFKVCFALWQCIMFYSLSYKFHVAFAMQ